MVAEFPKNGRFIPKTDYKDIPPLDTEQREKLRKNTAQALDEFHKKLEGDYQKNKIIGKIKTFDSGYGLRIRDDNGVRVATAYKGEEVRIIERKTGVSVEHGEQKNFIKIEVYDNHGKVDKKRTGWVAEDFVEINSKQIDELLKKIGDKVEKNKKINPTVRTVTLPRTLAVPMTIRKNRLSIADTEPAATRGTSNPTPEHDSGINPIPAIRKIPPGSQRPETGVPEYGIHVEGSHGYRMVSPHDPQKRPIDVRGLPPGTEIESPYPPHERLLVPPH